MLIFSPYIYPLYVRIFSFNLSYYFVTYVIKSAFTTKQKGINAKLDNHIFNQMLYPSLQFIRFGYLSMTKKTTRFCYCYHPELVFSILFTIIYNCILYVKLNCEFISVIIKAICYTIIYKE